MINILPHYASLSPWNGSNALKYWNVVVVDNENDDDDGGLTGFSDQSFLHSCSLTSFSLCPVCFASFQD